MNYVVDKLESTFRDKKAYFFVVLIMFCLGISFGLYIVKYMGEADRNDLAGYFNGFTNSIKGQPINYFQLLLSVIKKNIFLLIPMLIFGVTFFGFPFILFIDLLKGFTLGYTFSFIACMSSRHGIIFAIASVLPQNIFYIPCFIALSVICLEISSEKFKRKFFKNSNNHNLINLDILNRLFIIIILFFIGVLIETYVTPGIIKLMVG